MKIELTCSSCQSVLRVDAEHAGKQLRCPTCQGLTQIPAANTSTSASDSKPSKFNSPMQDWKEPANHYPIQAPVAASQSSGEVISLVFGIMGIFLNFGCGCLFPVWLVLNLYGLYLGYYANGNLRTAALILNAISIAVGLTMAFRLVLSLGFG